MSRCGVEGALETMKKMGLTSPVRCVLHNLGPHLRASHAANIHIYPRKKSEIESRRGTPDRLTGLEIIMLVIVQVQGCRGKRSKYHSKPPQFTVLQKQAFSVTYWIVRFFVAQDTSHTVRRPTEKTQSKHS
jgi:hypothetical protein